MKKVIIFVVSLFLLVSVVGAFASKQKRGARKLWPPVELRGSKEQRIKQNIRADQLGITQIKTNLELHELVASGRLVELVNTSHYFVERGKAAVSKSRKKKKKTSLPCPEKDKRIFVRIEAKIYLDYFARKHFLFFHKKLKITSGARSLEEQALMRTKGSCYYTPYAAEADSPLEESLHARGNTIDISRTGMPRKEISWIRAVIIADKVHGVEFEIEDQEDQLALEADPIEERICYHIAVFIK